MKKIILFLVCFFIFISSGLAINLNSESLIAQDINSGRIFYEKNSNDKRLIASTTKIMTAILAIESNKLETIVPVGEEVLKMYGSNIYLELNEHMLLIDLVYGLLMRSGNDASVVIANYVGKTEENFVKMMNAKAKELGMDDTIFMNPHGLDDDTKNYSTAKDLSLLYSYAYHNETFRKIIKTKKYTTTTDYKSYVWQNKTKIVSTYDKSTGGKTGYTPDAGRVLVSSASNNDLDLVIASFNHGDYDYVLHKDLFEDIFYNYQNYQILNKEKFSIKNSKYENIYIKEDFFYPVTDDEKSKITKKIKYFDEKYKDGVVGEIYIYLEDEIIFKTQFYNKESENTILDRIKNWFNNLLN